MAAHNGKTTCLAKSEQPVRFAGERRLNPRVQSEQPVLISIGARNVMAQTTDLSAEGVAIELADGLVPRPGEACIVTLADGVPRRAWGVWESGRLVGLRMEDPFDPVDRLLDPETQGTSYFLGLIAMRKFALRNRR